MNYILYKIIPTMGNISNYQYFHVLSLLEPFSLWNNVDWLNDSFIYEKIFIECPSLPESGKKVLKEIDMAPPLIKHRS